MPRGKKTCPECLTLTGPRTKICSCGHGFHFKPPSLKIPKGKQVDWTTLEKGDVIKCIQGSGPYWLSKDNTGDKIMLGEKGRFEVVEVYNRGPRSCGLVGRQIHTRGKRSGVTEFIYMGESWYNDDMGNYNEPHKIVLLKKGSDDE